MNDKSYHTWKYPDIPENVAQLLGKLNSSLVIVGVIGRSKNMQANKMSVFGMKPENSHVPMDGQIQCYYKPGTNTLLLHFETTHDEVVTGQLLLKQKSVDFDSFYGQMRGRFLRNMLLALHVCHIIVYIETAPTFDTTLVTVFRLLNFVREHQVLEFLPDLLRVSAASGILEDSVRLCTPRVLFVFENYPQDEEKTRECISAYEFQTEDMIYQLLRQYNIVTNDANCSLLALPNNKQFVFYNAYEELRPDHLLNAIKIFEETMHKGTIKEDEEEMEIVELSPFEGFIKPFGPEFDARESDDKLYRKKHTVWQFLQQHVQDAIQGCFNEGSFKQQAEQPAEQKAEQPAEQQSTQSQLLDFRDWHICMAAIHELLVANVYAENYETENTNYKTYLRDFEESLNYEKKFWCHLCELGLKKGIAAYKHAAPEIYGSATHSQLLDDAIMAFEEEGRGPFADLALAKLSDVCLKYWNDGRRQCEHLSLHGNPCMQPKDLAHDKHRTGIVHISTCNCGRTQGRREDPFTLRQANYEYYEEMAAKCNLCVKVKRFQFPVFTPSISDYRAAAFEAAFPMLLQASNNRGDFTVQADSDLDGKTAKELYSQPLIEIAKVPKKPNQTLSDGCSQPLLATYGSNLNMSIAGFGDLLHEVEDPETPEVSSQSHSDSHSRSQSPSNSSSSDTSSVNTQDEVVLQLKDRSTDDVGNETPETSSEPLSSTGFPELVSTTEYLPGLVHMLSGHELLPLFPSWSLACVGPSSIYSHNNGLQEHFQSGFLSGANFLLPWEVHVRLVQPQNKQHKKMGKKAQRYRKHGNRLALKVFVGFEYECSRGHRFMMCSPDRVLRGGADIERDTSSKVVNNNMPLYFPCPCRAQLNYLAQLMRIHVVTPKAPVNIIVDPKVQVGKYTFTLGCPILPRLSQSAYWILRLPYIYQGDNELIKPPEKLEPDDHLSSGCLLAGMFGIAETAASDANQLCGGTFTRL